MNEIIIKINIENETALLRAVVVGIADNFGGTPTLEQCYDPKSKEHVRNGMFPNGSPGRQEGRGQNPSWKLGPPPLGAGASHWHESDPARRPG